MSVFTFIKKFLIRYGKVIIRVGGVIGLTVSVFFLVSGIYFLCQNSTGKDSQGFFSTWHFEVREDSRAIVLEPDGIEFDGQWDMGEIEVFKVIAETISPGKELFIGSASQEDARSFLTGVEYDEITGLWILPAHADYQRFNGDTLPVDPVSQDFWIDTISGKGTKELIWDPEHDNTSLVIMNADGSAGLDLNIQVKTKAAILFIAGIGGLMIGVFLLLLSLMAILYTRRTPNVVYPKPLIIYPGKEENQEAAG
jgi:hypothetical protein